MLLHKLLQVFLQVKFKVLIHVLFLVLHQPLILLSIDFYFTKCCYRYYNSVSSSLHFSSDSAKPRFDSASMNVYYQLSRYCCRFPPCITVGSFPSLEHRLPPSDVPHSILNLNQSDSPNTSPSLSQNTVPSIVLSLTSSDSPSSIPSNIPSFKSSFHPSVLPSYVSSFDPSLDPSKSPNFNASAVPSIASNVDPNSLPAFIPKGVSSLKTSIHSTFSG